jgi:hypothetical protein
MLPASTGGSSSVSMAKPRSSFSFALHFAMRSFAAASDGRATQFDSVVMRPGSISHFANADRSSSRTRRSRTARAARYISGAADLTANASKLPEGIPETARNQLVATLRRDADGLIATTTTG